MSLVPDFPFPGLSGGFLSFSRIYLAARSSLAVAFPISDREPFAVGSSESSLEESFLQSHFHSPVYREAKRSAEARLQVIEFPFLLPKKQAFLAEAKRRLAFRALRGLRPFAVPEFRFPIGPRSLWNT